MSWFKSNKKILIVEDQEDIAENLRARLSLENYDLFIAADGKKGVEEARAMIPDLIIMDVMLPILDGFEATKLLRDGEETKHIPILILTALPHVKDAEKAIELGANDFLNKPFTNERLIQKVKKLLS